MKKSLLLLTLLIALSVYPQGNSDFGQDQGNGSGNENSSSDDDYEEDECEDDTPAAPINESTWILVIAGLCIGLYSSRKNLG